MRKPQYLIQTTPRKNKKSNHHSNCNDHLLIYIYLMVLLHIYITNKANHTHHGKRPTLRCSPSSHGRPSSLSPSPPAHHEHRSSPRQGSKKIKTKKLHLPHPCSLDALPSPTDEWSVTTHPSKLGSLDILATISSTSISTSTSVVSF